MTLEDLKIKIEKEAGNLITEGKTPKEISKYIVQKVDLYDLTNEEKEYVYSDLVSLEEQTNRATLINSSKAQQILINKRKDK